MFGARDEIQKRVSALDDTQRNKCTEWLDMNAVEGELQAASIQLDLLRASDLEQLRALQMRYTAYKTLRGAFASKQECSGRIIDSYLAFIKTLDSNGNELMRLCGNLSGGGGGGDDDDTDAVTLQAVLADASLFEYELIQPIFVSCNHFDLFVKSQELAVEMQTAVMKTGSTLQQLSELFAWYADLMRGLTPDQEETHFLYKFRMMAGDLVGKFDGHHVSAESCQAAINALTVHCTMAARLLTVPSSAITITTFRHTQMATVQDLVSQKENVQAIYETLASDGLQLADEYQRTLSQLEGAQATTTREAFRRASLKLLRQLHDEYQAIVAIKPAEGHNKLRYELSVSTCVFYKLAKAVDCPDDESYRVGMLGLSKCNAICDYLHQIKYKFSAEIIPSAMQWLLRDECADMLSKITNFTPHTDLAVLLGRLTDVWHSTTLNQKPKERGHVEAVKMATDIRSYFTDLYAKCQAASANNAGAAFFVAFKGTFYELDSLCASLKDLLAEFLTMPDSDIDWSESSAKDMIQHVLVSN